MRQKGFAPLIIIFIVAIVGTIGYLGYKNFGLDKKKEVNLEPAEQTNTNINGAPPSTCRYDNRMNSGIKVVESPDLKNWCDVTMNLDQGIDKGYKISYPLDWLGVSVGAFNTNIMFFNTKEKSMSGYENEVVLITFWINGGNFDPENLDKIVFQDTPGVVPSTTSIIDKEDKIVSKKVLTIGSYKVLKVSTTTDTIKRDYYLIDNGSTKDKSVYSVRVNQEVDPDTVNKMVQSFQIIR